MRNDRDHLPDNPPEAPGTLPPSDDPAAEDDFRLLSTEEFDGALRALEEYEDTSDEWETLAEDDFAPDDPVPVLPDEFVEATAEPADWAGSMGAAGEAEQVNIDSAVASEPAPASESPWRDRPAPAPLDEGDRLRAPRAQSFRRRLRHQLGLLPLTLYLLALGVYLLARGQDFGDLPDYSTQVLAAAFVMVVGFTAVFHALLSGRRERGLLLLGLWILVTAGLIAGIVYGVDASPDATEWWPLVMWSLGLTMFLVFLIERGHDSRLVLVGVLILVAGGVAYAVTTDRFDESTLEQAGDYWPLLAAVVGISLLPLAVRRRSE